MTRNCLTDSQWAYKPVQPDGAAASGRPRGPLARLATLAGGGAVLMMTARFGRSPVRDAAYRLRAWRRDLDLRLSWLLFASLRDWGTRWVAEQDAFAAGLILRRPAIPLSSAPSGDASLTWLGWAGRSSGASLARRYAGARGSF